MQGKIGWVDLHTDDAETSAAFYEKVFGWTIQRDPSMADYIMFNEGALGGGFSKEMPRQSGGLYLLTESIEGSLAAVEANGGKTVRERTPISEEIGAWAQFTDPSGNVMGLFEQAKH